MANNSSFANAASVTGPAANGTICASASMPSAQYEITIYAAVAGTVTAADNANMYLSIPGFGNWVLPVMSGGQLQTFRATYTIATGVVSVKALAAGGASAVYTAALEIRQIADWEGQSS